jgi:hypothetical protein
MRAGHRLDPDASAALGDGQRLPRVQRLGRAETLGGQVGGSMWRGDNGQAVVELPLYLAVEVVLVHVRKEHEIDGRQCLQLERRVGSAGRRHAMPEVHVVSPVQKVRISQDRKSSVPQRVAR